MPYMYKYTFNTVGLRCPKCRVTTERKKPAYGWTTTADHYYFLWDECRKCGKRTDYEPFRIRKHPEDKHFDITSFYKRSQHNTTKKATDYFRYTTKKKKKTTFNLYKKR